MTSTAAARAPSVSKKLPAAKVAERPAARKGQATQAGTAGASPDQHDNDRTGNSRTQQERRAEAEAKLLATARRLIARRGWAGTTLADVGEEAGYSRGLAGHYFGNKAGLLRAITEQINNNMMEEVRKAPPAEPGLASILAFIGIYLGRKDPAWTNTRSLLNLLTHALLEGSEHADLMVNFNVSMFKYIEDQVRTGIDRGEIDPTLSPPIAAEFIVGTLRGVVLQRLVKGGEMQVNSLRKHLQTLIEHALRAT
ncbi:TetR/AcrR family transcriptional regulator [Variovorax sp. KK3]|uniref:TetR/AcrR family transcriptional regulator n=1 Tax=Variovorax sp. KK3 TaxID=1855728 RepID=UPI0015C2D90A|nr:TetR/AcrR family transcriptional regulator [Variovorax sp. KK3]